MNIGLIDFDSKIPNLALMKLSAYHKKQGDNVYLNNFGKCDKIYVSCVFAKNKSQVLGLKSFYDCEVVIGGSGVDLDLKLPDEVEFIMPDYSIYPDCDYSLGFTSRGCNRNCYFCIVSKKEGCFKRNQHPKEFYDPKFNKIMFLDNNVLLDKDWFFSVMDFVKEHNLKYSWNQGLDIRLLDGRVALCLRENKFFEPLHFAWDHINLESVVLDKIGLLRDIGFKGHHDIQFFVYVDGDNEFESGLHRCNVLKSLDVCPFVMFNTKNKRTDRIKRLQRWANRKWLFWSIDFEEYR